MRIALIFPPYKHKTFSENLGTVDEEFCLAPPLILAYVAAIMEKHGHKVILIDARAFSLTKEETLERIKNFNPNLLAFRAEAYHFPDALEWIRYLKENLKIPVLSGGINFSLYPKQTISHAEIDNGINGEAIETLPNFLTALENGDSFKGISGLIYKDKEGKIYINPPSAKFSDFDSYPFPARHLLANDKYYSFISQLKNFTIMVTSTGCPFRCSFCAIHPNTIYRVRTPKNVVDEIEVCYRDFGIREIDFFDAVLFSSKARVLEIFREIERRNLKIEWSCRSRVDTVDEELLREASSVGCRQIYYGIESADHSILEAIKKDVKLEQITQAIKWSKKYGIRTMGFFMVGNPGDSKESVRRTIRFARSLDLDFVQVCRTIAKPGTELDEIMIQKTGRDYWREYASGKIIERRLPTPWCNLPEKEIESLTKEFYIKFYFRPRVIWSRLFQLRSLEEFLRYLKVGLKMLLQKSELYSHIQTDISEAEEILAVSGDFLQEARELGVAVVIPTYNEKGNIEEIISAVLGALPQAHIVIVDDNSPDGTGSIVQDISKRNSRVHLIQRKGTRGLGLAYKDGFEFVLKNLDSDYIFEMDADFSHNPQYLPVFLHFAKDYDLVTGSRFLRKVSIKNRRLWRNIFSKSTKWLVNVMIGLNLTDVSTGFKCFQRNLLDKIDFGRIESKGFAFQIEVSYAIKRSGFTIKEIPILFVERSIGKSKMSGWLFLEGICLVCKLSLRRLLGK